MKLLLILLLCFITSVLLTPLVKKLSYIVGAIDYPNQRKIHQTFMARLGGLAIYISFLLGILILQPVNPYSTYILVGTLIIVVTGLLDDTFGLSPKIKLVGQIGAACIVVIIGGLDITFINLPFGGQFYLGILEIPLTIIWIVGITNSINLIDGLDGLAAGVSTIALITISGMAITMGNSYVITVGAILICCTLGFLFFNFYPAKIFMGDTGALFLGFMISVLSLLGFKNVTFVSFIIPVIILGVPITDTYFAIIRRIVSKKPLTLPDKSHLHHCLIRIGYTHRQTVLIIYGIAIMCGIVAVIIAVTNTRESLIFIILLFILVQLYAERIGLFGGEIQLFIRIARIFRPQIKDKS
ncbi:glycosyltransferase family 4 protein [Neobacillus sp. K501]